MVQHVLSDERYLELIQCEKELRVFKNYNTVIYEKTWMEGREEPIGYSSVKFVREARAMYNECNYEKEKLKDELMDLKKSTVWEFIKMRRENR